MNERIRFGMVGTSWWADMWHLPNIKSHQGTDLNAICGRDSVRAYEMARKYSIPRVFTDYREMIASGGLDAVMIAAPDDLHFPIAMCALDAGLHVVCEKPMALTATQAKSMCEKAELAGVKHMIYYTYRWMPVYRQLRRLIEQGYLGRCYHCSMSFLYGGGRSREYQWRFDRSRSLGVLGDLGSHIVDLAIWLVGDIAKVCGHLSTFIDRTDAQGARLDSANDSATLAVQFMNGAIGAIQVSSVAHVGDHGQEQHLVLHGEGGTLETTTYLNGESILHGFRSNEQTICTIPIDQDLWEGVNTMDPPFAQIQQAFGVQSIGTRLFADSVLENRPIHPSFHDGLKVQRVLEAAVQSHEGGKNWVEAH
jgi:predicted dehydrogenase